MSYDFYGSIFKINALFACILLLYFAQAVQKYNVFVAQTTVGDKIFLKNVFRVVPAVVATLLLTGRATIHANGVCVLAVAGFRL